MGFKGLRLFEEVTEVESPEISEDSRKLLRNECLMDRYYFYVVLERLQMDDAYRLLERDFFKARQTILNILQECGDYGRLLRAKGVTRQELKKKHPWLNWERAER